VVFWSTWSDWYQVDYYDRAPDEGYVTYLNVSTCSIIINPTSGPSGTIVTLNGTGFANGDYNMSFGTQEAYLTGTVVDENISDTFFVPTIEPGIYDIIVTDSDGSARITQFIVTATTTLRARSIGHNLSIDGEHFSNEAGTGLTWYVYNSTWQNGPLLVNESYGNQVTVTEDGNFTGYWIVPETLVLGNIYTINATDDNGLWARTTITIVLMPMQKIF
jgi:hypothetical protein